MMRYVALLLLLVALAPGVCLASPSPDEIRQEVLGGHYGEAEAATKEILRKHPDSAKGHYFLGQIYNLQHDYAGAYKELSKAAELDKSLSFASNPSSFREAMKMAEDNTGHAPPPRATSAPEPSQVGKYIYITLCFLGLGLFALFLFMGLYNKRQEKSASQARDAQRIQQSKDIQDLLNTASDLEVALKLSSLSDSTKAVRAKLLGDIKYELGGYLVRNKQDNELISYATINSIKFRLNSLDANKDNELPVNPAPPNFTATSSIRTEEMRAPSTPATPSSPPTSSYPAAPAAPTTVVVNSQQSSNDGLFTGMLMGEMLAGNHGSNNTTIIERDEPSYSPPAPEPEHEEPSFDSGSNDNFDAGSSGPDFDSGGSDTSFDVGSGDSFDSGSSSSDSSGGW